MPRIQRRYICGFEKENELLNGSGDTLTNTVQDAKYLANSEPNRMVVVYELVPVRKFITTQTLLEVPLK